MTASLTPLPTEFVLARWRQRIADGLAAALDGRTYAEVHIQDITSAAAVGRKTLYDTFAGKDEIAVYLVGAVSPSLVDHLRGGVERSGFGLLLVELAATHRRGMGARAITRARAARSVVQSVASNVEMHLTADDDPLACTLPPGRHGLPREFVYENQRHRLYVGLAEAIAADGYAGTTIAQIASHAAVSRRTFYEHFASKEAAARTFLQQVADEIGDGADPRWGFDAALVEVAATAYIYGPVRAKAMAADACAALSTFVSALDQEVAHAA